MRYRREPGVEMAPMQEETVLFEPTAKKFCVLNATAAHLWTLLEQPKTEAELAQGLVAEFEGADLGTAIADVREVLRELTDLGVVVTTNGADSAA